MTKLEKIADGIEKAKRDHMEGVHAASAKARDEVKAIAADASRSSSWIAEKTREVVAKFNEQRKADAEKAVKELEKLYADGLEAAGEVLSRQPSPGEAAYLQAFMMKGRITLSDVEQAKAALKGSAVASAAMYEKASEQGLRVNGYVPGYIAVTEAGVRCLAEDKYQLSTFGAASASGQGSDFAFSCDSIKAALQMRNAANEFTTGLRAVAAFDGED